MLVQHNRGQTKVISYASRTLTEAEKKYSTTEKEGLAVVWACEKFHLYLYGIPFELITDHKPLEGLYSSKSRTNARIQRWMLRLIPYTYSIRYIPAPQNIADALSRLISNFKPNDTDRRNHAEEYIQFIAREATPKSISTREVEEASKYDRELSDVRDSLSQAK